MPQSLAKIVTHIIFSTKHRARLIPDGLRDDLNAYLAGTLRKLESPAIKVNCVADHAHILCCLSKNYALAKVIEEVKKGSSKWVKTKGAGLRDFHWQNGYGAFSVSQSNVQAVVEYIAGQADHHRHMTFQDELRAFFKRHRIEYDDRYVWD